MKAVFANHLMYRRKLSFEKGYREGHLRESSSLDMLLDWEDIEPEAVELATSDLHGSTEDSALDYSCVLYKALMRNKYRFVEALHDSGFVADASTLQNMGADAPYQCNVKDTENMILYEESPHDYLKIVKKHLDWRWSR